MKFKIKISLILGFFLLFSVIILLTLKSPENKKLSTKRDIANISSKANEFEDKNKNKTPAEWKIINTDFQFILEVNGKQVPIVKGENNLEYLHKNIYGEEDFYGVPYLDYQNNIDDDNLIIYGHSSSKKDLVFSFIKNYEKDSYWDTKILLIDGTKTIKYSPIALFKIDQNHQDNYISFLNPDYESSESFNYLKQLKENAYKEKIDNFDNEKLLTLVTCNLQGDDNQRYAVVFKKSY